MQTVESNLFQILRSSLGTEKLSSPVKLNPRQWKRLFAVSLEQQVAALVYDEIDSVGSNMPEGIRSQWQQCREFCLGRFDAQLMALTRLSAVLEAEGVEKIMVLKGLGLALAYPKPQLRECVDVDIFCFDDYKRVNEYVVRSGIDANAKESEVKEFCFEYCGIDIENHGRFTAGSNAASVCVENHLREMSAQLPPSQDPRLPGILFPSPGMGALHLLMHTLSHLAWSDISLRQLCDITMYFRSHREEIDLEELRGVVKEAGMEKSASLCLEICNRYLGLGEEDISAWAHYDADEERTVLKGIFHPFKSSASVWDPARKIYRKYRAYRFRSIMHRIVYGEEFPDNFLQSFAFLRSIRKP